MNQEGGIMMSTSTDAKINEEAAAHTISTRMLLDVIDRHDITEVPLLVSETFYANELYNVLYDKVFCCCLHRNGCLLGGPSCTKAR